MKRSKCSPTLLGTLAACQGIENALDRVRGVRWGARTIDLDLTGAAIPLEGIRALQALKLPVGGRLSFQLSAKGPVTAPTAEGKLRVKRNASGRSYIP